MRLVTYTESTQATQHRVGLVIRENILDIQKGLTTRPDLAKNLPPLTTLDLLTLIQQSSQFLPALKALQGAAQEHTLPDSLFLPEKSVHLLAPLPKPVSMRDGYAFRQHVEASRRNRGVPMIPEFDLFPTFYFTNHLAIVGPGPVFVQALAQEKLDFELEVAIVIGKECRNVVAKDADSVIFGFMVMNDWSARALQMEEMKMNLGPAKGKDFATALGPYLVTRDELEKFVIPGPSGERHRLQMKAFLNGKQLSSAWLSDMSWTFAQIIERASYGVTLYPGEVIGSGTAGTGCLMELNGSKITDNLWVKPGDRVVLEVDALGRLENTIVAST